MKSSIFTTFLFLLLLSSCNSQSNKKVEYTVLKGATLFDGNGHVVFNSIVVIKEDTIQSMGNANIDIPKKAQILDFTGKFITPGFVDAHVHFGQTGFFDARPDMLDITDSIDYHELQDDLKSSHTRFYEAYLRSGVTAVYDVGGLLWTIELQDLSEKNVNAPHIAATGPLLTSLSDLSKQQLITLSSQEIARETVKYHTQLGSTGIKIWQINLFDSVYMKSLRAATDQAVISGNQIVVHATELDQAKEALRLGAKVLAHSVEDKMIDDEFIELMKINKAVYCPTLNVYRGYYNAYTALTSDFEFDDPNKVIDERTRTLLQSANKFFKYYKGDMPFEEFMQRIERIINTREEVMATNLQRIYKEGIPIAVSTDAGNPGTLHGVSIFKEMETMQKVGIAPADIITMATKNGAMAMGRIDDFGTLENGKLANLVIFERDPSQDISNVRSIQYVMKRGKLIKVAEPFNNQTQNSRILYNEFINSKILNKEMGYSIYLPPNYDESIGQTYPVAYLLHGGGGDDTTKRHHRLIEEFKLKETFDEAISNNTIMPMVVVIPDAGMSYYMNNINGDYQYEDYFMQELIPYIDQHYRCKTGKEYRGIAGFSMGGFGALLYSLHHPNTFSACAAIGAAIRTDQEIKEMPFEDYLRRYKSAMGNVNEGDERINHFWHSNSILHLIEKMPEKDKGEVRFQIVIGDDDYFFNGNSQLHALMNDLNIPHEYRVVEGKHFEYFDGEVVNALQFLNHSFKE